MARDAAQSELALLLSVPGWAPRAALRKGFITAYDTPLFPEPGAPKPYSSVVQFSACSLARSQLSPRCSKFDTSVKDLLQEASPPPGGVQRRPSVHKRPEASRGFQERQGSRRRPEASRGVQEASRRRPGGVQEASRGVQRRPGVCLVKRPQMRHFGPCRPGL